MPSKKPKRRKISKETARRRSWVRYLVDRDAPEKTEPKRMNFNWHAPRLSKIWLASRQMDISIEAFIRFAAFERAVRVLVENAPEPILHEREKKMVDHRYSDYADSPYEGRWDLLPFNWRWRQSALDVIEQAAKQTHCDYRTFIDFAAFEKAVEIVGAKDL